MKSIYVVHTRGLTIIKIVSLLLVVIAYDTYKQCGLPLIKDIYQF